MTRIEVDEIRNSKDDPKRTIKDAMETDLPSDKTFGSNGDFHGPRKDYLTADHHSK